jgi:hypothetical protein
MFARSKMSEIERAVALLQAGELVAFPTETVYGLGADAANPAAVGQDLRRQGAAGRSPADRASGRRRLNSTAGRGTFRRLPGNSPTPSGRGR